MEDEHIEYDATCGELNIKTLEEIANKVELSPVCFFKCFGFTMLTPSFVSDLQKTSDPTI